MLIEIEEKNELIEIIRRFSGRKVAVIGDLMLDVYVWGKVDRISPEAPVPVVQVGRRSQCLGGAANVMRNVVTLGGTVFALGVVGDDYSGRELGKLLQEYGIDASGVMVDPERPTTQKQRVMAGSQQLLRIDYEELAPVGEPIRRALVERLRRLLQTEALDAVVIEDYAKGLFSEAMAQEIVDLANCYGVMVTLDPNPRNPMCLHGLTIMKPNRNEAYAMAGMNLPARLPPPAEDVELRDVARKLRGCWQVKYLLISLAAQGMALFMDGDDYALIPTRAREVYDVSGAGDTVIAACTLALAAGGAAVEAAAIANHAAGIVVGKLGTVTVTAQEVIDSIETALGG